MFCCIWTGTLSFSLYRHTNLFYVYCTHGKCSCTLIHYSDRVSPWPSCEWDSDGTTWLKQKQNDNKCSYSIIGCLTVTIWSRETETFLIQDWWTEAEVLKRPEKSMSSHRSKVVTASMQTHGCMQTLCPLLSVSTPSYKWHEFEVLISHFQSVASLGLHFSVSHNTVIAISEHQRRDAWRMGSAWRPISLCIRLVNIAHRWICKELQSTWAFNTLITRYYPLPSYKCEIVHMGWNEMGGSCIRMAVATL